MSGDVVEMDGMGCPAKVTSGPSVADLSLSFSVEWPSLPNVTVPSAVRGVWSPLGGESLISVVAVEEGNVLEPETIEEFKSVSTDDSAEVDKALDDSAGFGSIPIL